MDQYIRIPFFILSDIRLSDKAKLLYRVLLSNSNNEHEYAKTHNIRFYSVFVPTDAVLKVLNKDATYYLNKMNLESNLDRLESRGK